MKHWHDFHIINGTNGFVAAFCRYCPTTASTEEEMDRLETEECTPDETSV